MSVSETFQLSAPTTTRARSGLAALLVVLALGLAVLVLLVSVSTGGSAPHRVSGANAQPHLAR
ncbi:MAG TPA: hypothetical protein VMG37_01165 [Solirubrobacteraceae bacterium]|nr:hypothetical protein [Solirubrobacteraceae bacterium]